MQRACELGAAPGGAAQRLLAAGLEVIGVDPANIDPRVANHPRFTHWQKRARDVRVKDLRSCDWLVTDMNIDPTSTMAALERVLKTSGRRPLGVIATLKLPDWSRAEDLDGWLSRFASWGYQPRVQQLSSGGREICLVAVRRGRRPGSKPASQSASAADTDPVQT
jgi:23S rRNA (cytidine2498-2'-O)-methyltransferase